MAASMYWYYFTKAFKYLWEENLLYQNNSSMVHKFRLLFVCNVSYADFAININLHYLQQCSVYAKQITYSATSLS